MITPDTIARWATVLLLLLLLALTYAEGERSNRENERLRSEVAAVRAELRAANETPRPTAFEYQIISPDDPEFEKDMNTAGKEGWDLVFARRAKGRYDADMSYEVILRRPIGTVAVTK